MLLDLGFGVKVLYMSVATFGDYSVGRKLAFYTWEEVIAKELAFGYVSKGRVDKVLDAEFLSEE